MTLTINALPDLAYAYLLLFARIGTIFMLLPGFGEMFFSARMRLTVALLVTFVMFPVLKPIVGAPPQELALFFVRVGQEVLFGLFIGTIIRFVRASLQTAGAMIAQQIGVGFVTQVDPSQGGQGLVLGNFLGLVGLALIFSTDLHHLSLGAVHDSYKLFPIGAEFAFGDFSNAALKTFVASFSLAIQLCAPFLVAGLVFQIAVGVLSKLMPQLQIFFLALPVQITLGFLLFAVLLTTMMGWYARHVEDTFHLFMVP